jgi:hypothetical protein
MNLNHCRNTRSYKFFALNVHLPNTFTTVVAINFASISNMLCM